MIEITREFVIDNLPKRPVDANKGSMGTLLSITGSYSMAGACMLSAKAALLTGVGLLKQVVVESIYEIVGKVLLEPVFIIAKESKDRTVSKEEIDRLLNESKKATAVLIGCGLKNTEDVFEIVKSFIISEGCPLLIDADGINALSKETDLLFQSKREIILTPHVLEMARLLGSTKEYVIQNREEIAKSFTEKYENVTLVLKGHNTLVSKNGEVAVNKTGNAGMAKGGSGDVLSGITSSLLAQKLDPFTAAKLGVYIHGLAGDLAKEKLSETSMLPSDIIENIPSVFIDFEKI